MPHPDELTRKELNQFLEVQRNHIIDLQICISNIKFIIAKNQLESVTVSLMEGFIGHYISLAYSYCAITIFKLFAEKEKRSFLKLFNKLENFKLSTELLVRFEKNETEGASETITFTKEDIIKMVSELRLMIEEIKPKIDLIFDRRNTFYAHGDSDKKIKPEKLLDIDEINITAQVLFNKINVMFKHSTVLFENSGWSIDVIFN